MRVAYEIQPLMTLRMDEKHATGSAVGWMKLVFEWHNDVASAGKVRRAYR